MKEKNSKINQLIFKINKEMTNWSKKGIHNLILERICSIIKISCAEKIEKIGSEFIF